jgi:hypothetical protein
MKPNSKCKHKILRRTRLVESRTDYDAEWRYQCEECKEEHTMTYWLIALQRPVKSDII